MSKIVEKIFDAKKKIVRNIFRGAPNLFTSSDLNRQIEAFKYQLDSLEDKLGVTSDMSMTYSLKSGTLSVTYEYSYLKTRGCEFSPKNGSLSINMTSSAPTAYLCLIARKQLITYEADPTHELAGATFEDGTSSPSADSFVYAYESIILTHAVSNLTDLVGVIAVFNRTDDNGVWVRRNFLAEDESFSSALAMSQIDKSVVGDIREGMTYEKAINILNNRTNNISPEWTPLLDDNGEASNIQFRIQNNTMYVAVPQQYISLKDKKGYYVKLGGFPQKIKTELLSLFTNFNIPTQGIISDTGVPTSAFMPFGELGTFSMFRPNDTTNPDIYGVIKVALLLLYNGNNIEDIIVGCYIDHGFSLKVSYTQATQVTSLDMIFNNGPVSFEMSNYGENGYAYITRIYGAIPLPSVV